MARAGRTGPTSDLPVIAACAAHIPISKIPAHVVVIRDGQRLTSPPKPGSSPPPATTPGTPPPGSTTGTSGTPNTPYLQVGDQIRVSRPARFTFSYQGNRFQILHGRGKLQCQSVLLGTARQAPTTVLA